MQKVRVSSLQWVTALITVVVGAMLLISPHQFYPPAISLIHNNPGLWGILYLAVGTAQVINASFRLPRLLSIGFHLADGAVLLLLAAFFISGDLRIAPIFTFLGAVSVAILPFISKRDIGPQPGFQYDLFSILVAAGSLVNGLLIWIEPGLFGPPVYDSIRINLPALGAGFIVFGVWLLVTQAYLGQTEPSQVPAIVRYLHWVGHLGLAGLIGYYLAGVMLPTGLSGFLGLFGVIFLFLFGLPFLGNYLDRYQPSLLSTRLSILLALTAAIPLVLTVALISSRQERVVRQDSLRQQELLASAIANGIDDYVNLHMDAVVSLAKNPNILELSPQEQKSVLQSFSDAYPDLTAFTIYNANGDQIVRSDNVNNTNSLRDYTLYQQIEQTHQPAHDVLVSPIYDRPIIVLAAPIMDKSGHIQAIVTGVMEATTLNAYILQHNWQARGIVYLIDEHGKTISSPDSQLTATQANLSDKPPVSLLIGSTVSSGSLSYQNKSQEQLTGFARVPGLGWLVVVDRPADQALAGVYAGRDIAFNILLAFLIITIFAGALLARWASSPLQGLVKAVEALGAGEAPLPVKRNSLVEVDQLADSFDHLREHLAQRTVEREQAEQELRLANEMLEARVAERTADLQRELENRIRAEQAQQRLVSILEATPDIVSTASVDGKILYFNRAGRQLLGLPENGAVEGLDITNVHPKWASQLIEEVGMPAARAQGIWSGETAFLDQEGREVPVSQVVIAHRSQTGEVEHYSTIARDISERKRMELALSRNLEKLLQLIQISQALMAERAQEALLRRLIEGACQLTGAETGVSKYLLVEGKFRLHASLEQNEQQALGPANLTEQALLQTFHRLQVEKRPVRIVKNELMDVAAHMQIPVNQPACCGLLCAPLVNNQGQVDGLVVIGNKIRGGQVLEFTAEDEALIAQLAGIASLALQHLEAHREIEQRASELETILATLPVGVSITDQSGRMIKTNQMLGEIWGGQPPLSPDIPGYQIYQAWWAHNGQPIQPDEWAMARAVQKGEVSKGEVINIRRFDGGKATLLHAAAPLKDGEGHIIGGVTVAQDITALRRAEDALRRAQEELEQRVEERTAELAHSTQQLAERNQELSIEIEERRKVEASLQQTIEALQVAQEELEGQYTELSIATDALEEARHIVERERTRYKDLFEFAPDGYLVTDRKGMILEANRAAAELFNVQQLSLVGKPMAAYFNLQVRNEFRNYLIQIQEDIAMGKMHHEWELPLAPRQGKELVASLAVLAVPAENGSQGDTSGQQEQMVFRWSVRDITERKVAEQKILISAQRAEALADVSRAVMEAGYDYQSVLDIIAQATTKLFGDFSLLRMASKDRQWLVLSAYYHKDPERRAQVPERASHAISTRDELVDKIFRIGEGVVFPNLTRDLEEKRPDALSAVLKLGVKTMTMVPLKVHNQIFGTLTIGREHDETPFNKEDLALIQTLADRAAQAIANALLYRDLETAYEEEQRMRSQLIQAEKHSALSRMVASVAHELNNPIQTVQNCLYLLQAELPKEAELQEYLEMAVSESKRVSKLVTQLRESYRPSQMGDHQRLDLRKLLEQVETLLAPHLSHQNVEWQSEPASKPVIVEVIADQLKQVFLNISLNAIEAMQPKGGIIQVKMMVHPKEEKVSITFQDNGPGIPPETQKKIFEPFFTTKETGTGLGLSICYELVRSHGGEITVESEPGEGACFTVWLPLSK